MRKAKFIGGPDDGTIKMVSDCDIVYVYRLCHGGVTYKFPPDLEVPIRRQQYVYMGLRVGDMYIYQFVG